jgi:predicted DNA-binding transcriptional regulator AlpA
MSLEQFIEDTINAAIQRQLAPVLERLSAADSRADDDALLNTTEAAKHLGVSPITMSIWRVEKRGPEYVRIGGRCIRYKRSALDAFVESNAGLVGKKGRPLSSLVERVKTSGTPLGRVRKVRTVEQ